MRIIKVITMLTFVFAFTHDLAKAQMEHKMMIDFHDAAKPCSSGNAQKLTDSCGGCLKGGLYS